MHGPNRDGERNGGAGKKKTPSRPGCVGNLNGKAQADIGALDRHDDREQDKPRFVSHRHCRIPSLYGTATSPHRVWSNYKVIFPGGREAPITLRLISQSSSPIDPGG